MNPQVKEKWIKALRSGEYEQGKGVLRSAEDQFCCLGVLCDLYSKENPESEWETPGGDIDYALFDDEYELPPTKVYKWAGMENQDSYKEDKTSNWVFHLSAENDDGKSFDEIADLIEEHF